MYHTGHIFKDALIKNFPSVVNMADVHRQTIQRKHKHNESTIKYFYAMLALERRANMDEPSIGILGVDESVIGDEFSYMICAV